MKTYGTKVGREVLYCPAHCCKPQNRRVIRNTSYDKHGKYRKKDWRYLKKRARRENKSKCRTLIDE